MDPSIGRFYSEDPLFLDVGSDLRGYGKKLTDVLSNPQNMNSYSYVQNNPVGYIDPTGKDLIASVLIGLFMPNVAYAPAPGENFDTPNSIKALNTFVLTANPEAGAANALGNEVNRFANDIAPSALIAANKAKGLAAEVAEGIPADKFKIPASTASGFRIPDEVNRTVGFLQEIKNTNYQSLTRQLRDYISYVNREGYSFLLKVEQRTQLSKPLQKEVDKGQIILRRSNSSK